MHVLCSKGYIGALTTLLKRGVPVNALNKVELIVLYYLLLFRLEYHFGWCLVSG